MLTIRVEIPGPPHAQMRPRTRVVAVGGRKPFAQVYDAPESRSWKGSAQVHMQQAMDGMPALTCPVRIRILAVFELPASKHRKSPHPRTHYVGQKDWENVAKAVCDAGNGVLWVDDRQVARAEVRCIVGAQGEAPRIVIRVDEITAEEQPGTWSEVEDRCDDAVSNEG